MSMKHASRLIRFLFTLAVVLCITQAQAEIPTGYYNSAYNLTTSELKTALYKIINPHNKVSSYSALPSYFEVTDVYPEKENGKTRWWEMYSNTPLYLPWSGTLLNREHSLPKSWWGGNDDIPAYTDLNHLYPGEAAANRAKSNYPLGEVSATTTFNNGWSKVGPGKNSGGASNVFEPADEYKGDFARTYFYMVTCYQTMNWVTTWQVRNGTYPSLQQWAIDLLLKWHRADPVSQKEQLRNEKVYGFQNNRNPFIDYPELAEYIWGNKMGQAWNPSSSSTDPDKTPALSAPVTGMTLDFGEVALGKTITRQMLVKGTDLTSADLRLIIGGTDHSYFSIPGTPQGSNGATSYTIASSAAMTSEGTWVTIVYTPTELGEHTATGNLTGGGLQSGRSFSLRGQCLPVPTLSKPLNPSATDITDSTYLAVWDVPAGDPVDYYVMTRKIYKNGNVETREEIAETNELLVTDFAGANYETFSVHGVRLGYDTPESEVVTIRSTAIDDIWADSEPLVIESFPGLIRVRCSTPQTNLQIIDVAGRVIRVIPQVDDLYELTLTPGIYFVITDAHRRPVKLMAR